MPGLESLDVFVEVQSAVVVELSEGTAEHLGELVVASFESGNFLEEGSFRRFVVVTCHVDLLTFLLEGGRFSTMNSGDRSLTNEVIAQQPDDYLRKQRQVQDANLRKNTPFCGLRIRSARCHRVAAGQGTWRFVLAAGGLPGPPCCFRGWRKRKGVVPASDLTRARTRGRPARRPCEVLRFSDSRMGQVAFILARCRLVVQGHFCLPLAAPVVDENWRKNRDDRASAYSMRVRRIAVATAFLLLWIIFVDALAEAAVLAGFSHGGPNRSVSGLFLFHPTTKKSLQAPCPPI